MFRGKMKRRNSLNPTRVRLESTAQIVEHYSSLPGDREEDAFASNNENSRSKLSGREEYDENHRESGAFSSLSGVGGKPSNAKPHDVGAVGAPPEDSANGHNSNGPLTLTLASVTGSPGASSRSQQHNFEETAAETREVQLLSGDGKKCNAISSIVVPRRHNKTEEDIAIQMPKQDIADLTELVRDLQRKLEEKEAIIEKQAVTNEKLVVTNEKLVVTNEKLAVALAEQGALISSLRGSASRQTVEEMMSK
ncbi:unnamed protein product [Amoebophrya sp. A25]|nr:unnamed protein product [Amoebophrya sp. A25]|eukprot:GSA25T00002270001.1